MAPGVKRFQKTAPLHFIKFSCFHRFLLLDSPGSKGTVEAVLELTRARHPARVYAWVRMPEHDHLLLNEPPEILVAQFLKALKQVSGQIANVHCHPYYRGDTLETTSTLS
jgi:REP element-mobilizing transposase RayT